MGNRQIALRMKRHEPDVRSSGANPSDIETIHGKRNFTGSENTMVFDLEILDSLAADMLSCKLHLMAKKV